MHLSSRRVTGGGDRARSDAVRAASVCFSEKSPRSDGATALLHACHANKESIARLLVEAGAKINTQDKHGNTPMLHTVARGNLNLATFIHGAGGHPEVQNKAGREFIHQNWHMYYNTYSQIYNANS